MLLIHLPRVLRRHINYSLNIEEKIIEPDSRTEIIINMTN